MWVEPHGTLPTALCRQMAFCHWMLWEQALREALAEWKTPLPKPPHSIFPNCKDKRICKVYRVYLAIPPVRHRRHDRPGSRSQKGGSGGVSEKVSEKVAADPRKESKKKTSLNKEARLLKFHFSYAIIVFGDDELKCSKCYDRKAKIAFKTSNNQSPIAVIAKGRKRG